MSNKLKTFGESVKSVLHWAVGINVVVAAVLATLNAVYETEMGGSVLTTVLSVGFEWLLTFGQAFLQGAVFFLVLGGFVAAIYFVLDLVSKAKQSLTGKFDKKK